MEVLLADRVHRECKSQEERRRHWGERASHLGRLLFELTAIANLADAALLPGVRLTADGEPGCYLVTTSRGLRLSVVSLSTQEEPTTKDQELETITTIVVSTVTVITQEERSA